PSGAKRAHQEPRLARPSPGRATDPSGSPGTDAEPSPAGCHRVAASLPPSDGTPREGAVAIISWPPYSRALDRATAASRTPAYRGTNPSACSVPTAGP